MKLVKEMSYLAPEGELTGTITSGKLVQDEKNGRTRESIRLTIAVDPIPSDPTFDYRVRADYWATQANDFFRDAKRVLGVQANKLTNTEGEIVAENLALLEGKRVKFSVVHDQKPGHQNAYRKVIDLRPEQRAA